MGAADSKLQFKNHIFRLFESRNIPPDDGYWKKFWQQPESVTDVFSLFTANDIRVIRDSSVENLQTLTRIVSTKLLELSGQRPTSLAPADLAQRHHEILNCVRTLTRIVPFWFEVQSTNPVVDRLVKDLFWNTDTKLACRLIDAATGLLFEERFTIPAGDNHGDHIIWETGIGCSKPMVASHELISHRVEILRFLLTLASDSLYMTPTALTVHGSPYVTYMVTRDNQHEIMAVLCSLLNTCMKYSPGWNIPYQHMLISDRNRQLVTYCLQYLTVLVLCPSSTSSSMQGSSPDASVSTTKNLYRHYMSKIHKQQDLQFLADSLRRLLSQPISVSSSYLFGSQRQIPWVTELSIMLWDLVQCNKKFKSYLLKSGLIHDFVVLVVYYACDRSMEVSKGHIMRLHAYILLYLTSNREIAKCLCDRKFESHGALPEAIRKLSFSGSYADYLIAQLVQSIQGSMVPLSTNGPSNTAVGTTASTPSSSSSSTNSSNSSGTATATSTILHDATRKQGNLETLHLIQTFVNCIYNISPYVTGLSYTTSSSLVHLFLLLSSVQNSSSPAKQNSPHILRCIVLMINYHFRSNRKLVFLILKNETALRSIHSALSGKAKSSSSSVAHQTLSDMQLESDTLQLLDFILDLVHSVKGHIQYADYFTSEAGMSKLQPHVVIESIGTISDIPSIDVNPNEPEEEFESVKFVWDTDSFGWYESILWGSIFQAESEVLPNSASIHDTALGNYSTNVGIWNGTNIQLFKLKEITSAGVSIFRPKGAVDAVADSVLEQFSRLISTRRNNLLGA